MTTGTPAGMAYLYLRRKIARSIIWIIIINTYVQPSVCHLYGPIVGVPSEAIINFCTSKPGMFY